MTYKRTPEYWVDKFASGCGMLFFGVVGLATLVLLFQGCSSSGGSISGSTFSDNRYGAVEDYEQYYEEEDELFVFENCDEARAYGADPVYEGDPGYGPHLDRDGDGIGCEPWYGD